MLGAHGHVARRQGEERSDGVLGLGGNLHPSILHHTVNPAGQFDEDF
jgi:hypothetical protein